MNHSESVDIYRKVQCLGREEGGENNKGTEAELKLFDRGRIKCQISYATSPSLLKLQ